MMKLAREVKLLTFIKNEWSYASTPPYAFTTWICFTNKL